MKLAGSKINTDGGNDWVENIGDLAKIKTGDGEDVVMQRFGEGTYIEPNEGFDRVYINDNNQETLVYLGRIIMLMLLKYKPMAMTLLGTQMDQK
jgi:hypothetical protein